MARPQPNQEVLEAVYLFIDEVKKLRMEVSKLRKELDRHVCLRVYNKP